MLRTFKYRLYPSKSQEDILARTFGSCRFVYNKALEYRQNLYNSGKKSVYYSYLSTKFLSSLKDEFPFLKDVPSQTLQQSLKHQESAYTNFFKHNFGFPKFKSKYNKQSCSFPQGVKVDFSTGKIFLPYLKWTKAKLHRSELAKPTPGSTFGGHSFQGKIKTCTVSKTLSNKYYISVLVETNIPNPEFEFGDNIVGIDLGIKDFAVLSNGQKIENPKVLHRYLEKLKQLQRKLSLKVKGSNNYKKLKLIIAKLHEKIVNIRTDFLHQLSRNIINNNHVIIMEDLDVKDMLEKSSSNLARYISDCSWSTFVV